MAELHYVILSIIWIFTVFKCNSLWAVPVPSSYSENSKIQNINRVEKEQLDGDDSNTDALEIKETPWLSNDYFEGDIKGIDPTVIFGKNAILHTHIKWTNGIVPYDDSLLDEQRKAGVSKAIEEIQKISCVRFIRRTNEPDYVYFIIHQGCYSNGVGRTGGPHIISLGDRCHYPAIVQHELLHALGFWHEQSRYDRDNHIFIDWSNIKPEAIEQFQKHSRFVMDLLDEKYDLNSIMHYPANAFAIDGSKPTIIPTDGQTFRPDHGDVLTEADIRKLNKLYCSSDM